MILICQGHAGRKIGVDQSSVGIQIERITVAIDQGLYQRLILWDRLVDFAIGRHIADRPLA